MKAIQTNGYDGPDGVKLVETADPTPGPRVAVFTGGGKGDIVLL